MTAFRINSPGATKGVTPPRRLNSTGTASTAASSSCAHGSVASSAGSSAKARRSTRRRLLAPLKRLKPARGASKQEKVAEARRRAARRLTPPPLQMIEVERLNQLKEAKLRAELRIEERGRGGGRPSGRTVNEDDRSVRRDAIIFFAALSLHAALLSPSGLRRSPCPALGLVALQSVCLRALLGSLLVHAFDSVDLGQMEIVRNMELGKRLFAAEARRYSTIVSAGVAVVSCGAALGGSAARAFVEPSLSSFSSLSLWDVRAFQISSFLSSRLGVFVLALLVLGRVMLPNPSETKSGNFETI